MLTVTGRLSIASASLNTKNKQRDKHLRSADFFDVGAHPATVVTVGGASVDGRDRLSVHGELEAAGRRRPISFPVRVVEAGADAATLQAELVVDRREFGMTWSPLRVASFDATATVVARFTRAS